MELNKKSKRYLIASILIVIIIISFFVIVNIKIGKKDSEKPNEPHEINDVLINGFDYSFLKLEIGDSNLVYSPLSIKYALSMLREGANGNTKEELDTILPKASLTKYDNIKDKLSLANSVFIKDTYKEFVNDSYLENIKELYNAEVYYDEFENGDKINDWISEKTFHIINGMISDEYFDNPNLEMILANALAIDMEWSIPFEGEKTTSKEFTKSNGEKIKVAMMNQVTDSTNFKYYQDDNYTLLSMPLKKYGETQLEFIAVLPQKESLHEFVTDYDFEKTLDNLFKKMHKVSLEKLSISIPRFQYDYSIKLARDLNLLGVLDIFSPSKADFSKISNTGLYVSDILHKADIKFSERGVRAAAATTIFVTDKAEINEPQKIEYLEFNKPFMYIIKDVNTDEVWFVGNVSDPLLWEDAKKDYEYR